MSYLVRASFQIGCYIGIAMGFELARKSEPKTRRKMVSGIEDSLLPEYLANQSNVYMDDLIGFLGISAGNDRANRIAVGNAMTRLGWIRRRHADRRWYYQRGPEAKA